MTPNTPEQFARIIMRELASIHALVEQVQAYEIAQMAERQGKSRQELSDILVAARRLRIQELYQQMLNQTGIDPLPDSEP